MDELTRYEPIRLVPALNLLRIRLDLEHADRLAIQLHQRAVFWTGFWSGASVLAVLFLCWLGLS